MSIKLASSFGAFLILTWFYSLCLTSSLNYKSQEVPSGSFAPTVEVKNSSPVEIRVLSKIPWEAVLEWT